MKMLDVVNYDCKKWFVDERLSELRNIDNPHDRIRLNDFELLHFKELGEKSRKYREDWLINDRVEA